jgi:hypothetical protein
MSLGYFSSNNGSSSKSAGDAWLPSSAHSFVTAVVSGQGDVSLGRTQIVKGSARVKERDDFRTHVVMIAFYLLDNIFFNLKNYHSFF